MAKRLTRITTRTGDAGDTGLGDGSRVPKDSARIAALGDIDELNANLGVLLVEAIPPRVRDALLAIQHDLFDLGGEVSIPGHRLLDPAAVERIEALASELNGELAPLAEFVLPGGSRTAALAHLARTVCRRAERSLVSAGRTGAVSDTGRIYLNRLSDLLFILARICNRDAGAGDILWKRRRGD
ncbi:MAG: cob(I)yrinic acid a,c-diamide adenosyltransferase [Burkholderiales bacterium]|nr:cob(I)yrinic acid a,c-diamide adenosyltransferase [Burkholderiales bacterium]